MSLEEQLIERAPTEKLIDATLASIDESFALSFIYYFELRFKSVGRNGTTPPNPTLLQRSFWAVSLQSYIRDR